jgi:hypothetical protein
MPPPHSRDTPYFSGHMEEKLDDFLKEYEELADSNGLTPQQKVETVIWYVAAPHHDFWMAAEGYATHDWDDFCQALRKTYVDVTALLCFYPILTPFLPLNNPLSTPCYPLLLTDLS